MGETPNAYRPPALVLFFCLTQLFNHVPHWKPVAWNSSGVPCTFPGKEGNPCSSGRIGRRNQFGPAKLKSFRRVRSARPRRGSTPTAAHPCRPLPGTPAPVAPWRAPSPQNTAKSLANTAGSEAAAMVAASVPVPSGAPRRPAPGPTGDRRPSLSGVPPHPHGLPAVPPDPCRPTPGPLVSEAQRRSGSGGDTLVFPEDYKLKTLRAERSRVDFDQVKAGYPGAKFARASVREAD